MGPPVLAGLTAFRILSVPKSSSGLSISYLQYSKHIIQTEVMMTQLSMVELLSRWLDPLAGWNGCMDFQLSHQAWHQLSCALCRRTAVGSSDTSSRLCGLWSLVCPCYHIHKTLLPDCLPVASESKPGSLEAYWGDSAETVWWQVLVGWERACFSRVSLGSLGPLDSLVEKISVTEKCHTLYSLVNSSCSLAQ